jgi:hypothetical protein
MGLRPVILSVAVTASLLWVSGAARAQTPPSFSAEA